MGAFFIIAFNAKNISNDFKEKIPITIYLRDNAKKTEIVQLQKKINLKNYTKSIKYISHVVVGFDNFKQIKQISTILKKRSSKTNLFENYSSCKQLIEPRLW